MLNALSVFPQYLLPKQALTELAGRFAKANAGRLTTFAIRRFIEHYDVDMREAVNGDIHSYRTFNDFFARALRPETRPIAQTSHVCPVDGTISQLGVICRDRIIQAKGRNYSVTALVGGDHNLAEKFHDGHFTTLYLSPRDYHRVHMPCSGQLTRMIYIPGALFSVNPGTVRGVPRLFARNERVVCVFDTGHGPFALVLVGATIVGSIATTWHGVVNAPRSGQTREWRYETRGLVFDKGEEMGRFLLGSTVVTLFPRNGMTLNPLWMRGQAVRFGEAMGNWSGNEPSFDLRHPD